MSPPRRIAAVVLPALGCEIVRRRAGGVKGPLAVNLVPDERDRGEAPPTAVLDLVDDEARRYGVRPGQKVVEAAALVATLAVRRVTYGALDDALGRVAEVALGLGSKAAVRFAETKEGAPRTPWGDAPFDTVWLDITGAAHLCGGEAGLCDELAERVAALGHRVRVAVAGGPRLAQALARWAPRGRARGGDEAEAVAELPVHALPIDAETSSWFVRLGVLTVGDLARLPRPAVRARLGARAAEVLELLAGRDEAPLVTFVPPPVLMEEAAFDEGVSSAEALLFMLNRMAMSLEVRLAARGQAAGRIEVAIPLDRSIARLRRPGESVDTIDFAIDLPAPLVRTSDLVRAIKVKLEQVELFAPAVGVRLTLLRITTARRVQFDLSRQRAASPDRLPALLAELGAELGLSRVGVLSVLDAHRPEARSRLRAFEPCAAKLAGSSPAEAPLPDEPARILETPVPLGRVDLDGCRDLALTGEVPVSPPGVVAVDQTLFALEWRRFVMRLRGVEWWTRSPVSRDYFRVWLSGAPRPRQGTAGEALVYVDAGEAFLQGWYE
jgi:protein ImuB